MPQSLKRSCRNYVTEAAAAAAPARSEQLSLDALLRQADSRIKRFGGLLKSDLDEIIQNVTETGSFNVLQI